MLQEHQRTIQKFIGEMRAFERLSRRVLPFWPRYRVYLSITDLGAIPNTHIPGHALVTGWPNHQIQGGGTVVVPLLTPTRSRLQTKSFDSL